LRNDLAPGSHETRPPFDPVGLAAVARDLLTGRASPADVLLR